MSIVRPPSELEAATNRCLQAMGGIYAHHQDRWYARCNTGGFRRVSPEELVATIAAHVGSDQAHLIPVVRVTLQRHPAIHREQVGAFR